jgi:hypothetical protein
MRPFRTISRRSFLGAVCGSVSLAACATEPIEERPYQPPGAPRHVPNNDYGRAPPCADADSGRHADRPGRHHCGRSRH